MYIHIHIYTHTHIYIYIYIYIYISPAHEANKLEVVSSAYTGIVQGISNTFAALTGVVGLFFNI